MPGAGANRSATPSVSAGIAAVNAHLPPPAEPGPRFPGEDGGSSLAEMAHRDLDAALQLLAERAQYITGASAAAIALRRGEHNDMLCRASAGSSAPELGALLSMEYGLSGECARTRQTLRCDDATRDARVNREGCRQLGIVSVVVMPIVSEEQVLGVFELFSGKPHAFDERDISALHRLSEMVETAVKHAVAAHTVPVIEGALAAEPELLVDDVAIEEPSVEPAVRLTEADSASVPQVDQVTPNVILSSAAVNIEPEKPEPEKSQPETKPELAPKKPLFWSAAIHTPTNAGRADETGESIAVPPVLRNLQKCQACGFPVSQGRKFCVECEEKQWRGERPANQSRETVGGAVAVPAPAPASLAPVQNLAAPSIEPAADAVQTSVTFTSGVPEVEADVSVSDSPTFFLSSASPSESWFSANKYTLGALLVVALVIGVIAWLR